jgi:hypothetical protein
MFANSIHAEGVIAALEEFAWCIHTEVLFGKPEEGD